LGKNALFKRLQILLINTTPTLKYTFEQENNLWRGSSTAILRAEKTEHTKIIMASSKIFQVCAFSKENFMLIDS